MEVQLKALQQDALATQRTLRQLQSRDVPSPFSSMPDMDYAMLGAMALLFGTMLAIWWYLWQRPHTRLAQQHRVETKNSRHLSEFAGVPPPKPEPKPAREPEPEPERPPRALEPRPVAVQAAPVYEAAPNRMPVVPPVPTSAIFARREPTVGFDSEAAANEVVRVRKSLAEKREARSMLREYEEESQAAADDNPTVQASLSDRLEQQAPAPVPVVTPEPVPPEPFADLEEAMSQPAVEEPANEPREAQAWLDLTPIASVELPETTNSHAPDYAVTLALAQESLALELWSEARELASEAVEFGDGSVKTEAQALLQYIEAHEEQMRRDAEAIPNDAPDSVV